MVESVFSVLPVGLVGLVACVGAVVASVGAIVGVVVGIVVGVVFMGLLFLHPQAVRIDSVRTNASVMILIFFIFDPPNYSEF